MTDVMFEPGCVVTPGYTVCGPGGVQIRERGKCHGLCAKDDARLVVREPNSPWYGPTWSCECGDTWESEGLYQRPFKRAWRTEASARFEKAWESALPEGTEAVRDWSEDGGGYLSGVVLPDGTAVSK